jgi:hypothetical protein
MKSLRIIHDNSYAYIFQCQYTKIFILWMYESYKEEIYPTELPRYYKYKQSAIRYAEKHLA